MYGMLMQKLLYALACLKRVSAFFVNDLLGGVYGTKSDHHGRKCHSPCSGTDYV